MQRLDITDPYHILFLEDTKEQLEQLEQEILKLESGQVDDDTLNSIMRMAHSLKGSSATLEIGEMANLAHHLEDLLIKVKNQETGIETAVMEVMLEAVDHFKSIYAHLCQQDEGDVETQMIIDKIIALTGLKKTGQLAASKGNADETARDAEQIEIIFDEAVELKAVKAFMIVSALQGIGEVTSVFPAGYEDLADEDFGPGLRLCVQGEPDATAVQEKLNAITGIKDVIITREEKQAKPRAEAFRQAAHMDDNATVRVNINKINKLINLVGELIIDKEALNKISKDLKRTYRKDASVNRLADVFMHINYLGSELQEIVLSTRMLPLENIFNKFPRMVRDLALTCNKNIRFVIEGKETGIDRGIIEELVDPLTHLLRNAVDHGIDDEPSRIARGKPPMGTITLSASQGENHVIITVSDDGNGIDVQQVRRKTIDSGFLTQLDAAQLSDEEIIQYIFEPGLSTAQAVTSISGRGVGLDVVKSNIGKLNGIIEIISRPDSGTRFIMKLPLTLAIIKAMLIREGACTFAIPVASIIEVVRLKTPAELEDIHSTAKSEVFRWREQVVPLIRLGDYFELDSSRRQGTLYVIVVGHGEKRIALSVDKVLGEQEIVIKSMADFVGTDKLFGELRGVSGVSILGDGSFAQIIDIAAISKRQREA